MATTVKSVRYTDDELTLAKHLLDSGVFPKKTESELLREAGVLGLEIFKAQALLAGVDVDPTFLRQLMIRLLPLFEVLQRYDALPQWLRTPSLALAQPSVENVQGAPVIQRAVQDQPQSLPLQTVTVAPEASTMLDAFGTRFLDDDED